MLTPIFCQAEFVRLYFDLLLLRPPSCSFDYYSFVVWGVGGDINKAGVCSFFLFFSPFILFSQDCFGNLGSFVVPCEFQEFTLYLGKMLWVFDRVCIKIVNCSEQCGQFNNINSSNPRAQDIVLFRSTTLISLISVKYYVIWKQ